MAKKQPKSTGSKSSGKTTKASTVEIGASGLKTSGGRVQEELLRELQGAKGAKIYREMSENDPIIGAFMFAVEQIMRQVEWKVLPASQDGADVDNATFVDECRQDMSITWGDFVAEALSMLIFGYAPFETVYKPRSGMTGDPTDPASSRYTDGKIGWGKLAIRAQETIDSWIFDPTDPGRLMGVKQRTTEKGMVEIPIESLLLFRTKSIKGNPEGRSILRNAYRPWYFKKKIEEIEGIGVERDLAGLPIMITPEGLDIWNENDPVAKANKTAAEEIIRNLRRDEQEGVLLPFGWELKLLASEGKRNFNTTEIVNRYDQRIAMTVLADFILLGHGGKFGSFALAKSKTSAFTLSIVGYLNVIRDVFNTFAIPRLFAVNGLDMEMLPKLDYNNIEVPPLKDVAVFVQALAGIGVNMSDPNLHRHLLNLGGFPADLTDEAGGGGTGAQGKGKGAKNPNATGDPTSGDSGAKPATKPVGKGRSARAEAATDR